MTIEASSSVVEKNNNSRSVEVNVKHIGNKLTKKKVICTKRKIIRGNKPLTSNSRRRRHEQQKVVPCNNLQRLFDACIRAFNGGPGTVPSLQHVQMLQSILDDMEPEDVGLSRNLRFFRPKNEAVTYSVSYLQLSIFFLPPNAVIPLHNHPEMTVFSKLLMGTMHIKAYDWADFPPPPSNRRLARLTADRSFTSPCDASVLYPNSGGNIHEFRAVTPCAVLDVIGPPYSKEDGRDCAYYRDTTTPSAGGGEDGGVGGGGGCRYGWLEEIEPPYESEMDGIEYMGPQIIVHPHPQL